MEELEERDFFNSKSPIKENGTQKEEILLDIDVTSLARLFLFRLALMDVWSLLSFAAVGPSLNFNIL